MRRSLTCLGRGVLAPTLAVRLHQNGFPPTYTSIVTDSTAPVSPTRITGVKKA